MVHFLMGIQTIGPHRQGTLTKRAYTDKGAYRRCAISRDKGPLKTRDPYMIYRQGDP